MICTSFISGLKVRKVICISFISGLRISNSFMLKSTDREISSANRCLDK